MKKIITILIIAILITIGFCFFGIHQKEEQTKTNGEGIKLSGDFIWTDDIEIPVGHAPGEWVCFRKNIDIDKDVEYARFEIAAESKYWLYINGSLVVSDGGLKRGKTPNSTYYDQIDATKYLNKGNNNISILVWYYGKSGYSHVDAGHGALLFQGTINENKIVSDKSWKVKRYSPFINADSINGLRLSESNLVYDANLEMPDWNLLSCDDSSWDNAKVVKNIDKSKWEKMVLRDIPFFTKEDIKEYRNFEDKDKVFPEDVILELKPDYNMQLYPYFKIEASKGDKIAISNKRDFNNIDEYGKIDYIAKDGIQEFESPAWISGENIYYFIPKGVKIISLGYRKTGYDINDYGEFVSHDSELDTLWKMAQRTLEVNMRDNYMDCPDRERALWMGDLSLEMEEAVYSLDPNANKLYEKAIYAFLGWKENGVFNTVPSSIISKQQLPIQNLMAIISVYKYYEYTGFSNIVKDAYPSFAEYMKDNWKIESDGKVSPAGNYEYNLNEWYDASENADKELENIVWYYYAYSTLGKMAELSMEDEDAKEIVTEAQKIKNYINKNYFDGEGYKSKSYNGYSSRANAIAVISGIADSEYYDSISSILINNYDNSTFMERYILEALCIMGKEDKAIDRMKYLYKDMIEDEPNNSTLWEYWDKEEGSKNHAWSGGPLVILSKYIAGIQPEKPGFREALIKPSFGGLDEFHAKVNSEYGTIILDAKKSSDSLYLVLNLPVNAIVAVEKMSLDPDIYINGSKLNDGNSLSIRDEAKFVKQDEKYIYYEVEPGEYIFTSRK